MIQVKVIVDYSRSQAGYPMVVVRVCLPTESKTNGFLHSSLISPFQCLGKKLSYNWGDVEYDKDTGECLYRYIDHVEDVYMDESNTNPWESLQELAQKTIDEAIVSLGKAIEYNRLVNECKPDTQEFTYSF